MRVSDFIEKSNQAKTTDDLAALFKRAISSHGYDYYAYGALTHSEQRSLSGPALLIDYPADWVEHYFNEQYLRVDPIMTRTPYMRRPYEWSELQNLDTEENKFMDEAKDANLIRGFCVPIHGPFGEVFAVSVSSDTKDKCHTVLQDTLQILAVQFHSAYCRLNNLDPLKKPPVRLTDRERECLLWSSRGKSSWDIGMILNLSEHTINFHISNAMVKLEAGSRILAIVKAIRMNLIFP